MTLKWNFPRDGGVQTKTPSVGGVWIFFGTTHSQCLILIVKNVMPYSFPLSRHLNCLRDFASLKS